MFLSRVIAVVVLAGSLMLPGHAQVKVSSVPISRDSITLRLLVDGTPSEATSLNGGLVRVSRKGGPALALVPTIAGDAVDLLVAEILRDPLTGNEGVKQVARVRLIRGPAVIVEGSPLPLEVELLRTALATGNPDPAGPCTICCITCDDHTTCACLVIMECGWCCCPGTCICPSGPAGTATCPAVSSSRLVQARPGR